LKNRSSTSLISLTPIASLIEQTTPSSTLSSTTVTQHHEPQQPLRHLNRQSSSFIQNSDQSSLSAGLLGARRIKSVAVDQMVRFLLMILPPFERIAALVFTFLRNGMN